MGSPVVIGREQIHLFVRGRASLLLVPRGPEAGDRPPHRVGSRIALQPKHNRPATLHVQVTRVTDIALGELGDGDAHQLGHRDLDELREAWTERHGEWRDDARAWRLVVALDPSEDTRFLPSQAGAHGIRALMSYTSESLTAPLDDAGEAVDEFTDAANARAAADLEEQRFEQLLAARRTLPLDERLRRVLDDAATRGVNLDSTVRLITRKISDAEERVYRPADRHAP